MLPRSPTLPVCLLACALALAGTVGAQGHRLDVGVWTGVGLDGPLEAIGYEVSGVPLLAGAELTYGHDIVAGLSGGLGLGGMYVQRSGTLDGEGFTASAWRFTVTPSLGYRLRERWDLRAGVEIRSAADLTAFDLRYEDNVRAHLRLGGAYALTARTALTASASRLLGASDDVANLVDPARTLRLGLRHRLTGASEERL